MGRRSSTFSLRMRSASSWLTGSKRWIWTGAFFGDEVFVLGEDLARSFDDAHRQGGQAGDFDAVASVGCAGFDFAEEQDLIAGFFYGDMQVADAGELVG